MIDARVMGLGLCSNRVRALTGSRRAFDGADGVQNGVASRLRAEAEQGGHRAVVPAP